jgi:hypothetical protein
MPPKRKRTSPAEEVDGAAAAASKEAAQQLLVGVAEAVEATLYSASGGGEPAVKKARGEEPDISPGSPTPLLAQSECTISESSGSDEGALCIDALAAVCEWVGSTADLVRLSCVSRTWRQLVARDGPDVGAVTGNEGARDGAGDGEQAYDRTTDILKAPILKNEVQKKQVRALLHMTRIIDHLANYCYGGACVLAASLLLSLRLTRHHLAGKDMATEKCVLVQFLNKGCLFNFTSKGTSCLFLSLSLSRLCVSVREC